MNRAHSFALYDIRYSIVPSVHCKDREGEDQIDPHNSTNIHLSMCPDLRPRLNYTHLSLISRRFSIIYIKLNHTHPSSNRSILAHSLIICTPFLDINKVILVHSLIIIIDTSP